MASLVGRRLAQAQLDARLAVRREALPTSGGVEGSGMGLQEDKIEETVGRAMQLLAAPVAAAAALLASGCITLAQILPHVMNGVLSMTGAVAADASRREAGESEEDGDGLASRLESEVEELGVVRIGGSSRGTSGGAMAPGTHRYADSSSAHVPSTGTAVGGTVRGHAAAPSIARMQATSAPVALLVALLQLAT